MAGNSSGLRNCLPFKWPLALNAYHTEPTNQSTVNFLIQATIEGRVGFTLFLLTINIIIMLSFLFLLHPSIYPIPFSYYSPFSHSSSPPSAVCPAQLCVQAFSFSVCSSALLSISCPVPQLDTRSPGFFCFLLYPVLSAVCVLVIYNFSLHTANLQHILQQWSL